MADTVGFIGLGYMGEGMVRRLISTAGRNIVVWNRSADKSAALLAEAGSDRVTVAADPAAVIEACSLIYVMLSTPEVVRSVYAMERGILAGVSAGKCIVDCATLAVEDMTYLNTEVSQRGGTFLEAPVSGSKGPAAQGQLIFLCGGEETLYKTCEKDLDAMGKAKFFLGSVGAGTRMKLCVNMVMGTMCAAYAEGLGLAQASGLDASQLLEVLALGVCNSPLLTLKGAKMLTADHAPNFPLKHAEKDMRLAHELGGASGIPLPVCAAADGQMKKAMEIGDLAERDFLAVYEGVKKPSSPAPLFSLPSIGFAFAGIVVGVVAAVAMGAAKR